MPCFILFILVVSVSVLQKKKKGAEFRGTRHTGLTEDEVN